MCENASGMIILSSRSAVVQLSGGDAKVLQAYIKFWLCGHVNTELFSQYRALVEVREACYKNLDLLKFL